MKLLIAAVLVTAGAMTATAAYARPAAPPTMHAGELVIGLNPPAVGFQVGTLRGNTVISPRGFEIDLANDIASILGITKIEWINVPFSGLFAPGTKPFDFAFEESTITAARARAVDFSAPYFDANQGVLLSTSASVPKSLADLRKLKVCGQATTTGLQYVQSKLHPLKSPQIYQTTSAAFAAVQTGTCEAFVMDVPIVASQKATKPSAYGPIAGQIVTREQYGAVFEKGSKLRPLVNAAIAKLTKNGTLAKLQQRWFHLNFGSVPTLH